MSKAARVTIEIVDELYDDETAQEAAMTIREELIDGYYRSARLVSVEELELPEEDDD
jgi:hypothetical protein